MQTEPKNFQVPEIHRTPKNLWRKIFDTIRPREWVVTIGRAVGDPPSAAGLDGTHKLILTEQLAASLREGKVDIERRLATCHEELAIVTKLLHEAEISLIDQQRDLDWLTDTSMVLASKPGWWFMLPPALQQRAIYRRLQRKRLFFRDAYLSRYRDVAGSGIDPLRHYIRHGLREGRVNAP